MEIAFFNLGHFTLGWSPGASSAEWPMAGAMLIQTGEDEFYLAGTGVVVTFKPVSVPALNIGILKVDEGAFENQQWEVLRHLNGDQTHQGRHVRIPHGQYGVQRVELYGRDKVFPVFSLSFLSKKIINRIRFRSMIFLNLDPHF